MDEREDGREEAGSGNKVLDFDMAVAQVGGDEKLLKEVLVIFLEDLPRKVGDLMKAISEEDREGLRRLAHSMKGASASIGAGIVRGIANDLERMSEEGDFEEIRARFELLEMEIERLQVAINEVVGS